MMIDKATYQKIAEIANTTPEIAKAVIDAYYSLRYVPVAKPLQDSIDDEEICEFCGNNLNAGCCDNPDCDGIELDLSYS